MANPSDSTTFSTSDCPKWFDVLPYTAFKCRVHPVVILTILDAYMRRDPNQKTVIGTLLGTVADANIVDISDCFVDRHTLTEEGFLQIIKDHHESMYELKQLVTPKALVVGWFCTSPEISELTCAVHTWFKNTPNFSKFHPQAPLNDPIHLMVDAGLSKGNLAMRTFVQVPMLLLRDLIFQFQEIQMDIITKIPDHTGLYMLMNVQKKNMLQNREFSNLSGFELALEKLLELLSLCMGYIDKVLNKTIKPNPDIGRFLSKVLSSCMIASDIEQLDQIAQNSLQDNLMVSYISHLAQLQFAVAEKLNTSFF